MRASQQVKYAIYGLFDLAYHGASRPGRVQEIGERQEIPARYLEQIFQKPRRAGLVASKRGPGGGYQLSRPAGEETLADVITAIQGAPVLGPDASERGSAESPGFVWPLLYERVGGGLQSITLGDLCREAAERGIERRDSEPVMYQI